MLDKQLTVMLDGGRWGGWLVWYVFADFLNWTWCATLPEALAEAAYWTRQGLEVGIEGSGGDRFDPSAAALDEPSGAVLP